MVKRKFMDADMKEAIEKLLEIVNHQIATRWVADCAWFNKDCLKS
ncbi:hypothetical protein ABIE66_001922 [Peribacillus sp. B2I2]